MTDDSAGPQHQRLILLNRLVSRSMSRAPQEHKPPIHGAAELFELIDGRRKAGLAIEFLGLKDRDDDEKTRLTEGKGHDYVALRDFGIEQRPAASYAKLLVEFVDQSAKAFPVVDTSTFAGRELSGEESERGATAAHVVVRLPGKNDYDDGSYRCAVESIHHLNRTDIERFLCRQLRRSYAGQTFGVTTIAKKGKKPISKEYSYWPRLELFADVSRKINFSVDGGKYLSHMVFTKRSEKKSIGKPTSVKHEDVIADVEYKVPAKQGPEDPKELLQWVTSVRDYFETNGYESKLYYRGLGGATVSGSVHKALAGASDLLMCPREVVVLNGPPKQWQVKLNSEITDQMISLLENDGLWERTK